MQNIVNVFKGCGTSTLFEKDLEPLIKLTKLCYRLPQKNISFIFSSLGNINKLKQLRRDSTAEVIKKAVNMSKAIWKLINKEKSRKTEATLLTSSG